MKQQFDKRKVGIALAIFLGLLITMYLGGLLAQLLNGYQKWLDSGGMDGEAVLQPVNVNPVLCIPKSFSSEGLRASGLILVGAGLVFLYVKFHDKFENRNVDERNYSQSKSGVYGTAEWLKDKEMLKILGMAPAGKEKGIILGEKKGKVVYLPDDTRLSKHIALFGSTGSRKSRGIIRPYLYSSILRSESVILTDPKMELYDDTSELFRKYGYKVRVLNLTDPQYGDSWNCMADMNGDTMLAQILTDVVITNTTNGKGDHFWDNGEGNLFKALVLFVSLDPSRGPNAKNLPAVYQLLTQNSKQALNLMFEKLSINHPAKAPYNLFAQASETVQAGIILGLGTRLQVLQNEAVQKITSYSDIDLAEPGRSKCAYFVIVDDQHSSMEFLSSLFFSFLFIKLVNYADKQPDKRCRLPVNIVFEELNNCGVIPDFGRKLSTIRSRALQCVLTVQGLGQLQNRYPDNLWSELLGNCDTQIMLGCNDSITAEYWSLRSGTSTVEVDGTMTVRKTIAVAQVIPQYRQTEGKGKRLLLTSDEVLRMHEDEMLVALRGQNILKLQKFDYTRHPLSKEIEMVSLYDYKPQLRPIPVAAPPPQTEPQKPKINKKRFYGPRLFGDESPPVDF